MTEVTEPPQLSKKQIKAETGVIRTSHPNSKKTKKKKKKKDRQG